MSPAGLLLMAVAGLWIAYLVPHRLRYRQQLLESRTDDRFSERLRVVRIARPGPAGARAGRQGAAPAGRVLLHPRRGGGPVDRPHALTDRVIAESVRRTAAERAQRAAYLARRATGARRRSVLAVVLLLASVAGWAGVAAYGTVVAFGAVPTVLLGGVLVLGRRAVVAGLRADAAWAEGRPARAAAHALAAPSAVGHAVRPSDAATEVLAPVEVEGADVALATDVAPSADVAPVGSAQEAADDATWVPVPVPRPAYSLKPAVRRPEPPPLVLEEEAEAVVPEAAVAEPEVPAVALDLDAILARRRAAGE